jgi:hypothetical protein
MTNNICGEYVARLQRANLISGCSRPFTSGYLLAAASRRANAYIKPRAWGITLHYFLFVTLRHTVTSKNTLKIGFSSAHHVAGATSASGTIVGSPGIAKFGAFNFNLTPSCYFLLDNSQQIIFLRRITLSDHLLVGRLFARACGHRRASPASGFLFPGIAAIVQALKPVAGVLRSVCGFR